MRIIICGAGRVGLAIAQRLTAERHDVTVIEQSKELARRVYELHDIFCIAGHAAYPDVLARARAAEADMIIAVTGVDETNMVACQVAHSLFNVTTKIASIHSEHYLDPAYSNLFSRVHLPVDLVISPDTELADIIMRQLAIPKTFESCELVEGRVVMLGIECEADCSIIETPLRRITELKPELNAQIVGLRRHGHLITPTGDDQLVAGDSVYCIAEAASVDQVLELFGHSEPEAHHIIIIGGGTVGASLAHRLVDSAHRKRIHLIENDHARAIELAETYADIVILEGDGMNLDLLHEAGVDRGGTIVTLTGDDKLNLLAALRAKQKGCQHALCLIDDQTLVATAYRLGIDTVIAPHSASISRILQETRRGRIRKLYSIDNGVAEIIEAEVLETATLVGRKLGDLVIPDGLRFGAVIRDGKFIFPDSSIEFKTHDRVVIFVLAAHTHRVEQMFRVSLEFF